MKILYLCNVLPSPPISGNRRRHLDEISILSKNHEIYLCVISSSKFTDHDFAPLRSFCKDIFVVNTIKISRLKQILSFAPKWWKIGNLPKSGNSLVQHLQAINPHIVIANYYESLALLLLSDYPLARVIFIPHDDLEEFYVNAFLVTGNLFIKLYYLIELSKHRYFESVLLANVSFVVVFSDVDKCSFQSKCRYARILVSPIALNVFDNNNYLSSVNGSFKRFIIVANGTHSIGKREIPKFLKAISRLIKYPCEITVIGPSWPKKKYTYSHLTVNYLGFVDDIGFYYKNSCAAIIPVFHPTGLNVKLAEALAYGSPIITTPAALARLPFPQYVVAHVCCTYKEFAECINNLCCENSSPASFQNMAYAKTYLAHQKIMSEYATFVEVASECQ